VTPSASATVTTPAKAAAPADPATPTELAVPGELRVLPDEAAKVQIDSIFPTTVYPDEYGRYSFEISGSNLGEAPNDNLIEVMGAGWQSIKPASCITPAKATSTAAAPAATPCLEYAAGMERRKLAVKGYVPPSLAEPIQIRIKVGNNISDPAQLTFSRVGPTALRLWALLISGLIATAVLALVWKGVGIFKIEDEKYSPLAAFFLDKQTDTYSLSKFQLIAWTTVAVFAYVFVYFCHVLVQWNFDFPAIPTGWPTLLGLSAGTTVAAVGITAGHGPKGAGPVHPSLADLVSTGGLVATDRFQFFVWTLVGCVGFLGLVLLPDPGSLTNLPDVPSGFLYLMGVSASGYLGGKLVRAPGPVISQLLVMSVVPATAASMKIDLKGQNLSRDAILKVDDHDLRKDQFEITPLRTQDSSPDSSFCTELTLTLKDAENYLEGAHHLTLTNKDGQMAVSTFPVDPLSITPGQSLKAGANPDQFLIQGQNFGDGMSAQWTDASGVQSRIPTIAVQKQSDTQLKITLTPGTASGSAELALISAIKESLNVPDLAFARHGLTSTCDLPIHDALPLRTQTSGSRKPTPAGHPYPRPISPGAPEPASRRDA
jgi:hypothetical protein